MKIPAVNLRPALEAAAAEWRAHLDALFCRMHFILGEEVAAFEREFAASQGARFAVGVGNGTDAIELCLRAAGLGGSGRQVLTSPLTAPFTGLAILRAGCAVRFADLDPETLLLDPESAAARAGRRTAAILPVHLYGQVCDLRRFAALARQLDAALIQDACQAHGARYGGRSLASFGPAAFSFYPTKNLGCLGDGGAVVTNRAAPARRIRLLRDGGRSRGHVSVVPGINSRLDEMQACYLRAFLPHLEEWNRERRRIADLYDRALADCPGLRPVRRSPGSVCHLYVVRARRRERLREFLSRHGIATGIHYGVPLHLQPAFRDCGARRGDLPVAERAAREVLSLPLWPGMPPAMIEETVERISRFYQ